MKLTFSSILIGILLITQQAWPSSIDQLRASGILPKLEATGNFFNTKATTEQLRNGQYLLRVSDSQTTQPYFVLSYKKGNRIISELFIYDSVTQKCYDTDFVGNNYVKKNNVGTLEELIQEKERTLGLTPFQRAHEENKFPVQADDSSQAHQPTYPVAQSAYQLHATGALGFFQQLPHFYPSRNFTSELQEGEYLIRPSESYSDQPFFAVTCKSMGKVESHLYRYNPASGYAYALDAKGNGEFEENKDIPAMRLEDLMEYYEKDEYTLKKKIPDQQTAEKIKNSFSQFNPRHLSKIEKEELIRHLQKTQYLEKQGVKKDGWGNSSIEISDIKQVDHDTYVIQYQNQIYADIDHRRSIPRPRMVLKLNQIEEMLGRKIHDKLKIPDGKVKEVKINPKDSSVNHQNEESIHDTYYTSIQDCFKNVGTTSIFQECMDLWHIARANIEIDGNYIKGNDKPLLWYAAQVATDQDAPYFRQMIELLGADPFLSDIITSDPKLVEKVDSLIVTSLKRNAPSVAEMLFRNGATVLPKEYKLKDGSWDVKKFAKDHKIKLQKYDRLFKRREDEFLREVLTKAKQNKESQDHDSEVKHEKPSNPLCMSCFTDPAKHVEDEVGPADCNCGFCDDKACSDNFIAHLKSAAEKEEVTCSGCKQNISTHFLDYLVAMKRISPEDRTNFFRNQARIQLRMTNPNFTCCSTPNCPNGKNTQDGIDTRLECDVCLNSACVHCGEDHSECPKVNDLANLGPIVEELKKKVAEGLMRPCAECGEWQERLSGCNSIVCPFCRQKWHWVYGWHKFVPKRIRENPHVHKEADGTVHDFVGDDRDNQQQQYEPKVKKPLPWERLLKKEKEENKKVPK